MFKRWNVGYRIISIIFIVLLLGTTFLFYFYNKKDGIFKHNGKLNIVVTTTFLSDALYNIAGDNIQIKCLMEGVDPHQYQLTQKDLDYIERADLILYLGINPDNKITRILRKDRLKNVSVDLSDTIPKEYLIKVNDAEQHKVIYDSHVWFDVNIWKMITNGISKILCQKNEANKEAYKANLARYNSKLEELEEYINAKVNELPKNRRKIVSTHKAFGYFTRYTGIEMDAVQGLNSKIDVSGYTIRKVVNYINDNDIKVLFPENTTPYKLLYAVKEGVHAKGKTVHIGEEIYADSLGLKDSKGGTYIDMYKYNIDTIVESLKRF